MRKINIASIMIPKALTAILYEDDTVRQGLEVMTHHGYTAVPVLDQQGHYLGSITEGDFLRHVMAVGSTNKKDHEAYKIGQILRRDFCPAVAIEADEAEVIRSILNQNFLPIVDSRNIMCGILTRKGVITYLASVCQEIH